MVEKVKLCLDNVYTLQYYKKGIADERKNTGQFKNQQNG